MARLQPIDFTALCLVVGFGDGTIATGAVACIRAMSEAARCCSALHRHRGLPLNEGQRAKDSGESAQFVEEAVLEFGSESVGVAFFANPISPSR